MALLAPLGCDRIINYRTEALDRTQFNGIESIPTAVKYLLDGQNCGKLVFRF
ncbi:hypothetical protein [Chamaesiphon minutus]|uniref:hypothetical protein n=1 Tax=Chamaesiphon minutus TaxID=1173032 RepID=UPI0002E18181|nr:hypothetical protein [Chamaesiphon minutus]